MSSTPTPRPRARDLGIVIGTLPPGTHNAITDVAGVRVGHVTLVEGDGPLVPGRGPFRTGVTAILPHPGNLFYEKVRGVVHSINGFGEVTNQQTVDEIGVLEGPLMITNTFNVARVQDAVIDWALARHPEMGVNHWGPSPIVAECSDMYLNDIRGRRVGYQEVVQAIESAHAGPVAEGSVGAGTGMSCFGFKGGVGTASRVIPAELGGFTAGVLVVSNFGWRDMLRVNGVPVGRELHDWDGPPAPARPPMFGVVAPAHSEQDASEGEETAEDPDGDGGSIVMVLATDAPASVRQLRRMAVRCGAGLAHIGSFYGHSSGDFVLAFSTAHPVAHVPPGNVIPDARLAEDGPLMSALFRACFEATEEAILNSLLRATTVVGRDGHVRHALPIERLVEIMRRYGYPGVGWMGEG